VLGGAMDANETPEITAIRETEEAVGYKISSVKKSNYFFFISRNFKGKSTSFYWRIF
jgi:8-oxo-dGTP pyrophosphatase MutT (NUDIX family)